MQLPSDPTDRIAKSFLVACFDEFFADMTRVRRAVIYDPWGIGSRAGEDVDRAELRSAAARSVRQRLEMLLEKQAAEASRRQGEHGAGMYREAQYVMAALADEVFLHLDWEGREAWASHLLESRLFGTQVAGEKIFQRVEHFLAERDTVHREIQAVYLLALSLGFEGRYRGMGRADLTRLRNGLYRLVFPRQASVVAGERHLFPQSYVHTLDRATPIRMPTVGRWAAGLAVVISLYLAVAHVVWVDVTADLRPVNASIAEIAR